MSWSQLTGLETCPRRWALSNASYRNIWDQRGYPRRFSIQQLRGLVIHDAVDVIMKIFKSNSCFDLRSWEAVNLLRAEGGYNGVLHRSIQSQLQIVEESPRMYHLKDYIRQKLESLTESMRTVVMRKITTAYESSSGRESQSNDQSLQPQEHGGGLGVGVHSEVRLRSNELGWMGDADEIIMTPDSCEIVDSKTGARKEEHFDQLMTYATIWSYDEINNPTGRLADRLTISYDDEEVSMDGPGPIEIQRWTEQLLERTENARESLAVMPPIANASYENCGICTVKQLCGPYWQPGFQAQLADHPDATPDYVDAQVKITHKRGARSYIALVQSGSWLVVGETVVLKSRSLDPEIVEGLTVRVNNLRLVSPDDSEEPKELVFTRWSERFIVDARTAVD